MTCRLAVHLAAFEPEEVNPAYLVTGNSLVIGEPEAKDYTVDLVDRAIMQALASTKKRRARKYHERGYLPPVHGLAAFR